jgi:hypothetical protein
VQADIVIAATETIERIQAANRGVSFQDTDTLIEVSEPNPSGQPRHACANDDRVVHNAGAAKTSGSRD